MIPTDTIDKLAAVFDSLDEFLPRLTEEQWKTASQLPGWTVQDNLSHIVGTERALYGLPETDHRASDLSHVRNPIGEMNEHHVDLRRHQSGAEVLAEFHEVARLRIEQLRTADDAYFATEAMTPTGPGTVADFLHIRVLDCWMHEQDMRRAVGMPGHLGGPAAEHTIDRLIRTIPIVVGKRAGTPEGDSVVIDITGAVKRHVVTTVRDGRATIVDAPPSPPLATVTMDSDTFLQLAGGRATHTELTDGWTISGDVDLGTRVVASFNMMI